MTNLFFKLISILFISTCLLATANAANLTCGIHLIKKGETKSHVKEYCGKPSEVLKNPDEIWVNDVRVMNKSRVWTYSFAEGQETYHITFENDRVTKISTGEYGFA